MIIYEKSSNKSCKILKFNNLLWTNFSTHFSRIEENPSSFQVFVILDEKKFHKIYEWKIVSCISEYLFLFVYFIKVLKAFYSLTNTTKFSSQNIFPLFVGHFSAEENCMYFRNTPYFPRQIHRKKYFVLGLLTEKITFWIILNMYQIIATVTFYNKTHNSWKTGNFFTHNFFCPMEIFTNFPKYRNFA